MSENIVHTVCTDGIEMEYVRFGTGSRPLVVIPGLAIKSVMKSAASLQVPYKMFMEDYTLYFFDRRKNVSLDYSLSQIAIDQVKVLDALGLKDIALYGVSQGGMVAQQIAAAHPDLVWKLVLGCSTSKAEPEQLEVIGNWAQLARAHDKDALVEAFIRDCFSVKFAERYSRALRMMYRDVSEADMDRFAVFARECDSVNTAGDLANIKCPTLVLAAGEDRVVTTRASIKVFEKLKAAGVPCEFQMFEGCGHAVFDESSEFRNRILEFLNQT